MQSITVQLKRNTARRHKVALRLVYLLSLVLLNAVSQAQGLLDYCRSHEAAVVVDNAPNILRAATSGKAAQLSEEFEAERELYPSNGRSHLHLAGSVDPQVGHCHEITQKAVGSTQKQLGSDDVASPVLQSLEMQNCDCSHSSCFSSVVILSFIMMASFRVQGTLEVRAYSSYESIDSYPAFRPPISFHS